MDQGFYSLIILSNTFTNSISLVVWQLIRLESGKRDLSGKQPSQLSLSPLIPEAKSPINIFCPFKKGLLLLQKLFINLSSKQM